MDAYEMIRHASDNVEFYIISVANPELEELDNIVDTAENIRWSYGITNLLKAAKIKDFMITKKLITLWVE